MTSDGQPYSRLKYRQIVSEQVKIGYWSKGGVSYSDTDQMTPYERRIAYETLREIMEEQYETQVNAINNSKIQIQSSAPRSGLTK